ncbi:MAG: TolC family protein [Verrucomicrobia bacterium]|nr:TolC family protein [Verrucomicrobiota bacterium]
MKRLVLSLATVVAGPLAAQTASPLSLDDCLQLSASRHPALVAARAGVTAAQEAVAESRAPLYPQVDVAAGYHRWQHRAFLPAGLSLPGRSLPEVVGPLDDWNGGLTSRVLLYDAGERRAAIEAAQARRGAAEADSTATATDLRHAVRVAFYTLAAASDVRAAADQNLSRAEAHQRLAAARQAAGAVPRADVIRLEAEVASARLQVISAESRVRLARGRLNTAMGRPAETPLEIAPSREPLTPPASGDVAALLQRALAQRPELAAGERRADAARAAVAAARAARAPRIRADAAFGWRDTVLLPDTRDWQAGLSLEIPVFDAGSRTRRAARTRADLAREEALLEGRRLQVRDEVWSAATEVDRTWASIGASTAGVRAGEEGLRVTRERYERGAAVITDLLETQTTLARAEAALAEARWGYLAARASLERAVGAER